MANGSWFIDVLRKKGLDVAIAMEICANDEEIYMEVLETALEEGRRKLPVIESALQREDWERYRIEVHGLKNAMRAVGAMELSEMALRQERAAYEKSLEKIGQEGRVLVQKYKDILSILEELLKK